MKKIGAYEIVADLAAEDDGRAYLGRTQGGALVVIKIQRDRKNDPYLVEEARLGIRLHHPNLVETLDLVSYNGRPALVLAYVPGISLRKQIARGPMPPAVVCWVGAQIASALDMIHEARDDDGELLGVLHRAVTPKNILIGHDGKARLIDLGVARWRESAHVTAQGQIRSALDYVAPEVLNGEPWSRAADVWSLGVSLWEAALGRRAVDGGAADVVKVVAEGRLLQLRPGEQIDPLVRGIVAQLLSMEPSCRPAFAGDVAAMFKQGAASFPDAEGLTARLMQADTNPENEVVFDELDDDRRTEVVTLARQSFGEASIEVSEKMQKAVGRGRTEELDDASSEFLDEDTLAQDMLPTEASPPAPGLGNTAVMQVTNLARDAPAAPGQLPDAPTIALPPAPGPEESAPAPPAPPRARTPQRAAAVAPAPAAEGQRIGVAAAIGVVGLSFVLGIACGGLVFSIL